MGLIRMIATDLDGTLLSVRSEIPEENIRALRRAMDAGVRVCLCTGRMIESTLSVVDALGGVNAPLSLFNGAMLYDADGDRILSGAKIARGTAVKLLERIEGLGAYVQAFPGRGYYYERRTDWSWRYAEKIGVEGEAVGAPLSKWLDTDVFKLLVLGAPEEVSAIAETLSGEFDDICCVRSSANYLEVIRRGVDKGTGLLDVCRETGVAPEEVLAFGDEMNDLPLILAAGFGYAMENGAEGVVRRAKYVAPRNTEAGLARVVEMYLDEGRMGGA